MIARVIDENPFVLLSGVPWNVYERFVDALAEHNQCGRVDETSLARKFLTWARRCKLT